MISIVGFGRPKFGGAPAAKPAAAAKASAAKTTKCPTCGK
jgi:hypothetical protein